MLLLDVIVDAVENVGAAMNLLPRDVEAVASLALPPSCEPGWLQTGWGDV